jgi:hypothetical protein
MNITDTYCIVLLTNYSYFDKMIYTLNNILKHNYKGDICIVIGDDLLNTSKLNDTPLLKAPNIQIKHFSDIKFSEKFLLNFNNLNRNNIWKEKIFQYHKFYIFDTFFKQWDYIFYIDSGINIFSSLQPILDSAKPNKFLAHSDAYPDYQWKLETQFAAENNIFDKLKQKYNLNIDYPQTTIMLYNTSIIDENTVNDLISLAEEFSISKTNDQGIIALYFTCIKKNWEQIQLGDEKTWYYDYLLRPEKSNKKHIMLKI